MKLENGGTWIYEEYRELGRGGENRLPSEGVEALFNPLRHQTDEPIAPKRYHDVGVWRERTPVISGRLGDCELSGSTKDGNGDQAEEGEKSKHDDIQG